MLLANYNPSPLPVFCLILGHLIRGLVGTHPKHIHLAPVDFLYDCIIIKRLVFSDQRVVPGGGSTDCVHLHGITDKVRVHHPLHPEIRHPDQIRRGNGKTGGNTCRINEHIK